MDETTPARLQRLQVDISRIRDGLSVMEDRYDGLTQELNWHRAVNHYRLGMCARELTTVVRGLTDFMDGIRNVLEQDLGVCDPTRTGE